MRGLVRVILFISPLLFQYWLQESGIVPWESVPPFVLSIPALILGLWLSTAGLDGILSDHLVENRREEHERQEEMRKWDRAQKRQTKREAKR
jgi:hypothetical protein